MGTAIPRNWAAFTLDEVLSATSGTVVRQANSAFVGVVTDSRAVNPGEIFVALVGEKIDAHNHVAAAKNAGLLLVSRDVELPDGPTVVRVADTTKALGDLARAHHIRWNALGNKTTIAITGSAGKTTTRRAIAALLGIDAVVHSSHGNLNNAIGIPMTLFGIEREHEMAVIEIGTSSRGEIAYGASLARPDVAVLTLIAPAHTEGIGSVDDVAAEKGSLFAALTDHGVAIANADDERCVAQLAATGALHKLAYGTAADAHVHLVSREVDGAEGARLSIRIGDRSLALSTSLLGMAGALATVAAVAVRNALGLTLDGDAMSSALRALRDHADGRLAPRARPDGAIVLDDAYNANGASMLASLRAAAEIASETHHALVVILGEMRELGALSESEHQRIADEVVRLNPRSVIAVAGAARSIADTAQRAGIDARYVDDAALAAEVAMSLVSAGDLVLVKGSRSVGLDRVVAALVSHVPSSGAKTPAATRAAVAP